MEVFLFFRGGKWSGSANSLAGCDLPFHPAFSNIPCTGQAHVSLCLGPVQESPLCASLGKCGVVWQRVSPDTFTQCCAAAGQEDTGCCTATATAVAADKEPGADTVSAGQHNITSTGCSVYSLLFNTDDQWHVCGVLCCGWAGIIKSYCVLLHCFMIMLTAHCG